MTLLLIPAVYRTATPVTIDNRFRLWDAATGQPRATLVPLVDQKGLALTADGHYRGTPDRIERDIVYVAQFANGSQVTLTPEEFEKRFGWKNDPERVKLR